MNRLAEVAALFLKLGFTAFGGPAAVTIQLGVSSLIDFFTASIAIVSLILLLRYKVNSTWLIAGGAIAGLLFSFIR